MKIFLSSFWIIVFLINTYHTEVEAQVWTQDSQTEFFVDEENIIESGVTLSALSGQDEIGINETLVAHIINNGTIDANIDTNGYNLYVQSAGDINGTIIGCPDSICVTQVITSDAELKNLNISGAGFYVQVRDMDGVDFLRLRNLNAASFEINDSVIIINDFSDWQNWDTTLSWLGANTLCISDASTVISGEYLENVPPDAELNVLSTDENKLYRIDFIHDDIGIKLNLVRETDYQRIFIDNRGAFLENIRLNNLHDKMLMAMDAATSMNELHNIMNSSYRFNHSILMRPVKSINNLSMVDVLFDDDVSFGFVPFYIWSDNTNDTGARLYINTDYDDYRFTFALHLSKFQYEDSLNDFGGFVYGVSTYIKRKFQDFSVIGLLGFDIVDFDTDNIYTDNGIDNETFGYVLHGGIDGVYDFNLVDNLVLSLFGGGVFQKFNVIDFSENDVELRGGGKLKYNFVVDGVKYEYGALAGAMVNGDIFGSIKVGFESLVDSAGVSLNIGMYKEDSSLSYRASINANILF